VLHGRRPWPELKLHGRPWGAHRRGERRGRRRGVGGHCWEAPWGAARALGLDVGLPLLACVLSIGSYYCCSREGEKSRQEGEEKRETKERRGEGKRKGRKRKGNFF
jgi:hypothetical protein